MRNKGFTLIELLAVIVILAIIALIATPIVLGIINESKENSNRISAQYMIDAVEKAYGMAYTKQMGAVPTLDQVAEEFDMNGASWNKETNKVSTTDGAVVCTVVRDSNEISVECPFGLESETMELASN